MIEKKTTNDISNKTIADTKPIKKEVVTESIITKPDIKSVIQPDTELPTSPEPLPEATIEAETEEVEEQFEINDVSDVDTTTELGKLLLIAISILSTRVYTDKTPASIIDLLHTRSKLVFTDK